MRKILAFLTLSLVLLFATSAMATISVVGGTGYITVTLDSSNDFAWATATVTAGIGSGTALSTLFPNGLKITKININSVAGTVTVLRDGISTGATIPPSAWTNTTGGNMMEYYVSGRAYKPSAFFADQTTPNGTKIDIEYSN